MNITTIIPTLCEASRRAQLLRAIDSIHGAAAQPVRILVVVNGQRFDPELLAQLRGRLDVEVIYVSEGSQTNAQLVGRRAVETPYFSFLDDDDEYLPGALDLRRATLESNPLACAAVTNSYACSQGKDTQIYSRMENVAANPLFELFQENWMNDCNHLFRTASVGPEYFVGAPPVLEWTWLGFRLTMDGKKIATSNAVTSRYNNTPNSLSKSASYLASRTAIYERMLAMKPPGDIADIIRRRKSSAWHEVATAAMMAGERSKAADAHVKSLFCHWSGLKYAPFSRHLIRMKLAA